MRAGLAAAMLSGLREVSDVRRRILSVVLAVDFPIDHAGERPRAPLPFVEPVERPALDEHRLRDPDEFIPGGAPFSDYLSRENVLARYAAATDVFRPERSGESRPSKDRPVAERGPGGWPRLGDVSKTDERIERRVRVSYNFERYEPMGTRIDVVG